MKTIARNTLLGLAATAALGLTACAGSTTTAASPTASMTDMSSAPASASAATMDPAANLVGPGCDDYAKQVPEGEGSVAGMAQDPVAVAASNNPLLTTLTKAVSGELNPDVNLVDTLNGDQFTVFAPVDEAFKAVPEKDLNAVVEDADTLTAVLTYHVVPGQFTPEQIPGTHTTVEGQDIEVTGSGDNMKVNGANVICGGVQTANATVYLIDGVLLPPAKN
jgi:uncharacterized surface protein with fasciclin (FAS1) repeats